jgi:hypothetical protein
MKTYDNLIIDGPKMGVKEPPLRGLLSRCVIRNALASI